MRFDPESRTNASSVSNDETGGTTRSPLHSTRSGAKRTSRGPDLLHAGVPAEGIEPLLKAMRTNLGHLNELRAQVLARSQPALAQQVNRAGAR
jgi:hypothetical protein